CTSPLTNGCFLRRQRLSAMTSLPKRDKKEVLCS
ncbi:hypothetical protein AVDCRST_MAG94-951, partial [uncultured Leptolyngbya sp.]